MDAALEKTTDKSDLDRALAMASFKIIYQKNRQEKRKIYQEPETVNDLIKILKNANRKIDTKSTLS